MSYLLDTNVMSEWRKSKPNQGVTDWYSRVHIDDLFVSVVTIGEIRRGVMALRLRRDHRQAALYESWLENAKNMFAERLVPVGLEIAEEWGNMDPTQRVSPTDALIAATAQVHGWTVVTRNVKDFERLGVRVLNPFTE